MTLTTTVDPAGTTTVQFALDAGTHPGEVSVVGSFNGWTAGTDPLVEQGDGTRAATVTVPADQDVHFRYLGADGVWFDDPDADEVTDHGGVLRLAGATGPAADADQHTRADLLPEEAVVGSDDPDAQAAAILEDSETRVREQAADVGGASAQTGTRTSAQATDPV